MTEITSDKISFNISFERPERISNSQYFHHELEVTILDAIAFTSTDGWPLHPYFNKNRLMQPIMRQKLTDDWSYELIDEVATFTVKATTIVAFACFIVYMGSTEGITSILRDIAML